ncbi:MAG: radical SAM protein [Candidatus Omnitrophica bacterium]|nr:radical SAM protein [Candidatus Omnitrophota bacterium]
MIKELRFRKEFTERLERKRDKMDFPRNVIFEITHQCNLRCRHCYVVPDSRKKELTTSQVKSVFKQLVDVGCLHLTLTGGEPLVRPDIISLIDYARRLGLFIHLFTNATLINLEIADKLGELSLTSLEISFHSLKPKRFDSFTRVEGSFDSVMKAIRLVKERKESIALKINITKANLDEIDDFKEFANDLDAVIEWGTILRPRNDGSQDNLSLRLEPEEALKLGYMLGLESILDEPIHNNKECHPPENKLTKPNRNRIESELFRCGIGSEGLVIDPYGELKPCLVLGLLGYSIFDSSLKQAWINLRADLNSMKPTADYKCLDCNLGHYCSSCPARAKLECNDMNSCPDYYRRLAELRCQNNGYKNSRI